MGKMILREGPETVLIMKGALYDVKHVELEDKLRTFQKGSAKDLILDFRQLEFCDSTFLGVLIGYHFSFLKVGKRLRMQLDRANTESYAYMLFHVSNLFEVLDFIE